MRQFPLAAELYASTEREEPASWRDEYFVWDSVPTTGYELT